MVRDTLEFCDEGAREAGRNPDGIEHILIRETYIHRHGENAEQDGNKYIVDMYKYYLTLGVKMFVRGKQLTGLDDPLFDHLSEERFIIGSPKEAIQEINRYKEEVGINYITCRMVFAQANHETISKCIELFGKEVIPAFG